MDDLIEAVVEIALEIIENGLFAVNERKKDGARRTPRRRLLLRILRIFLWVLFLCAFALGCILGTTLIKILCGVGLLLLLIAAVLAPLWRGRRRGDEKDGT